MSNIVEKYKLTFLTGYIQLPLRYRINVKILFSIQDHWSSFTNYAYRILESGENVYSCIGNMRVHDITTKTDQDRSAPGFLFNDKDCITQDVYRCTPLVQNLDAEPNLVFKWRRVKGWAYYPLSSEAESTDFSVIKIINKEKTSDYGHSMAACFSCLVFLLVFPAQSLIKFFLFLVAVAICKEG